MNRLEYLGLVARLKLLEDHATTTNEALTLLTQLVEELKAKDKSTSKKGGAQASSLAEGGSDA